MKRIRHIFSLFVVFLCIQVDAQELLNQYLESAAYNNPLLKAKFNEYQASLEVIPQVGILPDPQLAFGYFIQPVETRNGPQKVHFSVSQMFPWFGMLNVRENLAAQTAKAKYESFKEAKSKLFHEIKVAYYDLYVTRKAIQITKKNLKILESFHRLALTKLKAGKTSAVDGLMVEMELADLKNQLVSLKDTRHTQFITFNNLLNVDNNTEVILPDTLWDNSLLLTKNAIFDSIVSGNHELFTLDFHSKALNYKKIIAKKSGNPSFSIGLDYIAIGKSDNQMVSENDNGKDAILFPKIGITIPLYRNKYKSLIKEMAYLQQSNDEQKTDKINMLETIFENTYKDYNDADRRIDLFNKQTGYAMQVLRILETEYTSGKIGFEELLYIERKILKYNLELEKARADKQAALSFIYYLMGN